MWAFRLQIEKTATLQCDYSAGKQQTRNYCRLSNKHSFLHSCTFYKIVQTCTVALWVCHTLSTEFNRRAAWTLLFLEKPFLPSLSCSLKISLLYRPVSKDHKYLAFTATKHCWVILSTSFPFWFPQRAGALEGNKLFSVVGGLVWVNIDTVVS